MDIILIIVSTFVISLISWVGIITIFIKDTLLQKILLYLVAFAAGSLMGGAFLHLIAESIIITGPKISIFLSVITGFTMFLFLEQFLHWHHYHSTLSRNFTCRKPFTYMILFADGLHNFIGGVAIGSSFVININAGLLTAAIEAAHEIPQELGDYAILVHGGWERKKALFYNFLSALTIIPGGIAGYFFSLSIDTTLLLPFAAGNFLYIAASDLIPEIKHETNLSRSVALLMAFICGIMLITILKIITR